MLEKAKIVTREIYESALRALIGKTRGMRENVEPAVQAFKQEAMPYSETALEMLISSGYIDDRYRSTTPEDKKGALDELHEALSGNETGKEPMKPERARMVWEVLCECYVPAPEEKDPGRS